MPVYDIAMRQRFRGLTRRDGMLVSGDAGWGEFSPFWDYDSAESAPWWRCAVEAADRGWPAAVRDTIPVNVTVPAISASLAHAIVTDAGGCTTAKVKVAEPGDTVTDEVERLRAVREALGPVGKIRIDANGGWDVETALSRLAILDRAAQGLEYAEQPVARVDDLARVRRRSAVPIAADESIRRADDPHEVVRLHAADIVVLKVQPLGGVRACLELAEAIGLPVVVSSALETSVGIAAGVALAAALPELPYACGLATVHLLERDVCARPLLPVAGHLPVVPATPDPELVGAVAAPQPLVAAWRERREAVIAEVTEP